AETGGTASGRLVAAGLPRARGDAEVEGVRTSLRNAVGGHGTDDGSDQSRLSWPRGADTGPSRVPAPTAGAMVEEADRSWSAAADGMVIRRTGSVAAPATAGEAGDAGRKPNASSRRPA